MSPTTVLHQYSVSTFVAGGLPVRLVLPQLMPQFVALIVLLDTETVEAGARIVAVPVLAPRTVLAKYPKAPVPN